MTLTPHELAVAQLSAAQGISQERIKSLRFIKNSIIGNRTKKDLYIRLGIVSRLVDILVTRDDKDPQLKIQAVIVLGSFAFGNESNVVALADSGVIEPLLHCLAPSGDAKLIEAAARTINAICGSPNVNKQDIFQSSHLHNLVMLLDLNASTTVGPEQTIVHTSELVASILSRCCDGQEHQMQIAQSGAIPLLIKLLISGVNKSQEAALDALAALSKDNASLAKVISQMNVGAGERPAPLILRLVRDKSPSMRLAAANCLTHLNRANVIPEYVKDIKSIVLPTLVKMLQLTGIIQEQAPKVLAYLIWESESMQKAVCEMDAISKLSAIISHVDEEDGTYGVGTQRDRLKENALFALAAISQSNEDCRKMVIDSKVLTHIVTAMSHPSVGVRAAACQCTRSLSRSVKTLRTSLVDAGIAMPLFLLLSDEDPGVQSSATATLCNIVLDFSPMKKSIMEKGVVAKFVHMINFGDFTVRLNAIWALKNLLFEADSDIKGSVMRQFGYQNLALLLNDGDVAIQEQALSLLRNLVCKREVDIEQVFLGLGEGTLLTVLEEKLAWDDNKLVDQALYVLVNIATGSDRHKQSILNRTGILHSILNLMAHDSSAIKIAALWCVINLTWYDEKVKGSSERVRTLRHLGFEERLRSMLTDPDLDVRDRVKTALQHFNREAALHQAAAAAAAAAAGGSTGSSGLRSSYPSGVNYTGSGGRRTGISERGPQQHPSQPMAQSENEMDTEDEGEDEEEDDDDDEEEDDGR